MKMTKFLVWFTDNTYKPQCVEVTAFDGHKALILAQAERIKAGLDFTFHHIEEEYESC